MNIFHNVCINIYKVRITLLNWTGLIEIHPFSIFLIKWLVDEIEKFVKDPTPPCVLILMPSFFYFSSP